MGENSFCSLKFSFEDLEILKYRIIKKVFKTNVMSLNGVPVRTDIKDQHGRKLEKVCHCYGMNFPKIMKFLKIIDFVFEIL